VDVINDIVRTLIPDGGTWLTWLIQAALAVGVVMLIANAISGVLAAIPVVGPTLATITKIIAGRYQQWLADQVPNEQAGSGVAQGRGRQLVGGRPGQDPAALRTEASGGPSVPPSPTAFSWR